MQATQAISLSPQKAETTVPTLLRLAPAIVGDRALALLASRRLRAQGSAIVPSGIDAVACVLGLRLLTGHTKVIGLALPRGRTGLPALLGVYLICQRWGRPQLHGSVLVATARGELSESLRGLTFEGSEFEQMRVGKLVWRPPPVNDHALGGAVHTSARRAVMRSLDRSGMRPLSRNDGNLLFARLGAIPPPAPGIITFAVIDTVGAARPSPEHIADAQSPDPWTLTYNTLRDAEAEQFWIGELGDPDFERFCSARKIPIVRITWPLVNAASTLKPFDCGGGLLASRGVCERSRARSPLAYRLIHDPDRDQLAREAYTLLGMMRRRVHGAERPEPVHSAYQLLALLSRLACSLEDYERAAAVGSPVFNRSARTLLASIERARGSAFRGLWKDAHERYWHTFLGVIQRLAKHAEAEPAKLHALFEAVVAAQAEQVTLVVRCPTETERRALRDTLQELDVEAGVEITTYSRRDLAGGADVPRRTLLLSPPPPWQASTLLSAEAGTLEALVYSYELPKLRQAVAEAESAFDDDRSNAEALDGLDVPKAASYGWRPPVPELLAERPAFGSPREQTPENRAVQIPDTNKEELWRQLVDLWGTELPEPGAAGDGVGGLAGGYAGLARLVRFLNAPPVLMRDDRVVDVIADADGDGLDEVVSKFPGALIVGEHIAFLPGTEHNSLREGLMAAWDESLATERQLFEPLWRAAIIGAVERRGIPGLARRIRRLEVTVRSWYEDRAAPQQPEDFEAVLIESGNPAAWSARAPIWRFLQTTRTNHRVIGKKLRGAITEALADTSQQPNIRDLERLTGSPVGDLLDAAEELIVASVSEPAAVPLSLCGRYLPVNHPILEGPY